MTDGMPRIRPLGAYEPERPQKNTSWTVHRSRTAYDGSPWLRVDMVDVTAPNSDRFEHAAIWVPDAAVALIVDEQRQAVLMLRRERWVIGQDGYELLGGLVDDGEDPVDTARRELLEESGYVPHGPSEHLLTVHPMPGLIDSAMHVFLWRQGAEQVCEPSDPYEAGTVSWIPLERVDELADGGQLLGATTAVALYRYRALP
ncbi:NUDIX hydrolase [Prauserella rugosa]|nr:NUDIX hydrolase [Prauserella rugosa]